MGTDGLVFSFNKLLDRIKADKDRALYLNYLDTLIDNSPDLVWFKDTKGAHVKVNDAFCSAVNKTKAQVQGRGHYYIWDLTPEDYSSGEYVCLESEDMVIEAKRSMVFDELVKTKEGKRQFITNKSPIFDEYGNILGTVGQAHDVTDLKNISRELNLVIENMPYGVIVSDDDDVIMTVNSRVEQLTGFDKKEMVGCRADSFYFKRLERLKDTAECRVEIVSAVINGEYKILEVTRLFMTDVFKSSMGIMRVLKDITVERQLEEKVINSANTDFLTGLYNRRYFYEYMSNRCLHKAISVLTFDLDNFKKVNDTSGHQKGDEALVLTSNILKSNFPNELVARFGGDEFVVVLMSDNKAEVEKRTAKVLNELNESFKANNSFSFVAASIGVAVTARMDEIDPLLKKSDVALYEAKNNNKGTYCFYEG
jgi:diguanylate cyclase (GGDEF)-like protein/PAS domain S-box-containing protein